MILSFVVRRKVTWKIAASPGCRIQTGFEPTKCLHNAKTRHKGVCEVDFARRSKEDKRKLLEQLKSRIVVKGGKLIVEKNKKDLKKI